MQTKIIAFLVTFIAAVCMTTIHADNTVQIPFVGCPADGQVGPIPPPTGGPRTVHLNFKLPGPIAYYEGKDGVGAFAPAGWHCFVTYGSAGAATIVSAHTLPKSGVPSGSFDPPVLVLSVLYGDTSGRFDVARLGSMLFPDITRDFVKSVEDEGIESKADIEVTKYPKDRITHLSNTLVEFETPADTKGLGTEGYVNITHTSILGLIGLDDSDGFGMSILRVSMGTKDKDWTPILLKLNTPCITGDSCQSNQ